MKKTYNTGGMKKHLLKSSLANILTSIFSLVLFLSVFEFSAGLYFHHKHKLNEYADLIEYQHFTPDNKKEGERRVFLVGESAARGVPYSMDGSVSGFLQKLLNEAGFPDVK